MKIKKLFVIVGSVLLVAISGVLLVGCSKPSYDAFTLNGWEYIALNNLGKSADEVDITKLKVSDFINLSGLMDDTYLYKGGNKSENNSGWYATLIDNFDVTYSENSGLNPDIWATSRHDIRHKSRQL